MPMQLKINKSKRISIPGVAAGPKNSIPDTEETNSKLMTLNMVIFELMNASARSPSQQPIKQTAETTR
jgi:hypothetical protein